MEISGYKVLISGASSGIGAACAAAFAAQGADLLLLARRQERLTALAEGLTALAERGQQQGGRVLTAALDVRDQAAVAAWVEGLPTTWSAIDILINNAGLARGMAPLHKGELRDWEEMIDTNLKGLLYLTRAVLPGMVERRHGHVINIGSIAGHEAYANGNVYCATKYAVTGLSRALGIDTLGTGVRVTSVDPGLVETEFAQVRFRGDQERAAVVYEGLQPLTGDDVAEAVVFCATRPAHANVREMILMPSAQASANHMHRQNSQ